PDPALVADLGDRLAHVCARVAEVSLAGGAALDAAGRGGGPLAEALSSSPPAAPAEPMQSAPRAEGIRAFVPRPGHDGRFAPARDDEPTEHGGRFAPLPDRDAPERDLRVAPPAGEPPQPPAPPPAGVEVVDLPPSPAATDPLTSLA